jgi:low affinity Fe/Cu permease
MPPPTSDSEDPQANELALARNFDPKIVGAICMGRSSSAEQFAGDRARSSGGNLEEAGSHGCWHVVCEYEFMLSQFCRFARSASVWLAHPVAFVLALISVIIWAAVGPLFHYSADWQLVINTGTTILTFLMVFLIQNTQNRDAKAMQLKLDELLRSVHGARNEMIELENLSEEELQRYCKEFESIQRLYRHELEARHHCLARGDS